MLGQGALERGIKITGQRSGVTIWLIKNLMKVIYLVVVILRRIWVEGLRGYLVVSLFGFTGLIGLIGLIGLTGLTGLIGLTGYGSFIL